MAQYRRLIAAGCGGDVNAPDIDTLVGQLLETLENESGRSAPADGLWM
jgi:hypothetical protein